MSWDLYLWFAMPAIACWLLAGVIVFRSKNRVVVDGLMLLGIAVLGAFIVKLWVDLERPPLRTMGETRLWYSFFLSVIGYITYRRWHYKWMLTFSGLVASVFLIINILNPEIQSKNLMPALQSYWFVPHVTVYILSYSMLGAATIASFIQIRNKNRGLTDDKLYQFMDNLVYVGFGFLMLGLLSGAVWAKEAWGHYWSWDPKETWALVTSVAYMIYIHLRLRRDFQKLTLWVLPIAFILLMITWIGVNYLPAAQSSVHVYS